MPCSCLRLATFGVLMAASLLWPTSLQAAPGGQTTPTPEPTAMPSGCGAAPGGQVFLDPSLDSETVHTPYTAVAGVPFSLSFDSNRTTGYQWMLAAPYDSTILQLDSHTYNRPSTTRPGAGGSETFTFTPLCPGSTTISFVYRRPWEQLSPTDRREIYDITVQ